jgi:hypothetical protein
MIDYAKAQSLWRKHKSALTRAKKTNDPNKVIAACDAFFTDFDANGLPYPDDWHLFERAREDAELQKAYA